MKEGEGIMLNSCLHTYCRHCLIASIELHENIQIKCPTSNCDGFLLEREIKAVRYEIIKRYKQVKLICVNFFFFFLAFIT